MEANRKSRWLDGGERLGSAIILDPSIKERSGLTQTVSIAMEKKGKTQPRIEEKS